MEAKRAATVFGLSLLALAIITAIAPLVGSASISFTRAFAGQSPDKEILFFARLPRVLMALLAGMALSTGGVLFQALLRDALATPYTLGVSSGASLGAVVAIVFGLREIGNVSTLWLFAFLGAAATLALVLGIASEGRRISSFTLLLSGVTINSICLALILFLQNLTSFGRSLSIMRWLMGGIDSESYSTLLWLAAVVLPVCVFIFWRSRQWNLLAVGDEWAAARGIEVRRAMLEGYFAGSILAGAVTSLTGPIGFVGLIVPHALRLKLGADHRVLIPAAALLGAAFLILCDMFARVVLSPVEIPVGVITAMLGGPFFIWLLKSKRRSLWL